MSDVRDAQLDDIPFLIEKAIRFNEKHFDIPLNVEKLIVYLDELISNSLGVALRSDKGMIGGIIVSDPLRDWTAIVETAWFSEGRDGIELLKAFEQRAKDIGVDEVRMTTLESNPVAAKLLERRGYSRIETSHRLIM